MSQLAADILYRAKKRAKCDNFHDLALALGMNPSTLRSRMSRNTVPYEELIEYFDGLDLIYVLKGYEEHGVANESKEVYSSGVAKRDDELLQLRAKVNILKEVILELKKETK